MGTDVVPMSDQSMTSSQYMGAINQSQSDIFKSNSNSIYGVESGHNNENSIPAENRLKTVLEDEIVMTESSKNSVNVDVEVQQNENEG